MRFICLKNDSNFLPIGRTCATRITFDLSCQDAHFKTQYDPPKIPQDPNMTTMRLIWLKNSSNFCPIGRTRAARIPFDLSSQDAHFRTQYDHPMAPLKPSMTQKLTKNCSHEVYLKEKELLLFFYWSHSCHTHTIRFVSSRRSFYAISRLPGIIFDRVIVRKPI